MFDFLNFIHFYFKALLLKTDSSKLHRKYAVALSKKADLMYRTEHKMEQSSTSNRNEKLTPSKVIQNISTIQSLSISDLCNLADVHFGKAVVRILLSENFAIFLQFQLQ